MPVITGTGVTGEGVSALTGQAWVCEGLYLVRGGGGDSPKRNEVNQVGAGGEWPQGWKAGDCLPRG